MLNRPLLAGLIAGLALICGSASVNAASHHVLIVSADGGVAPSTLAGQISALDPGGSVAFFDGGSGTPTVAQLNAYDIVVPFSNFFYADPVTLGNNLVTYMQGGGVVVAFNFSWFGGGQSLQGTWLTGGYSPFNNPGAVNFTVGVLGAYTVGHPLMQGVASLSALFRETMTLASGATQVAAWNDGGPLIAYKGQAVGVSAYVGDYADNWAGDFGRVILNAGDFLGTAPFIAGPAKVWIGLKNSDDVGLRIDLMAQAFINSTKVGEGVINNILTGSSGFNNAVLQTIAMAQTASLPLSGGDTLQVRMSARRTCSGPGHNSGTVRLWYNGQAVDTGLGRDAGSRLEASQGAASASFYLRSLFLLSQTPGTSRVSVDQPVDSSAPCPGRPFSPIGSPWSFTAP